MSRAVRARRSAFADPGTAVPVQRSAFGDPPRTGVATPGVTAVVRPCCVARAGLGGQQCALYIILLSAT